VAWLSTGEINGRFFGVFANTNRPLISPVESVVTGDLKRGVDGRPSRSGADP
jgi:hypothetical protein